MTPLNEIARVLPFITGRQDSLFLEDIATHDSVLNERIKGTSVLVVGAGGSIGSAFTREILRYQPKRVVVLDTNVNALTELVRVLRSTNKQAMPEEFITYPVSYSDPVAEKIIRHHGPFDIVANFAAHKHVRSEKDLFSVEAMFENNVFRAKDFIDRLKPNPPKHFFCVSTDKAANPVNLMGASKKLMELLLLSYQSNMSVTTARFANVAFSNGSLLAGFLERLRLGQPLSSPSDVKRYFVTPEESGQICLLSCILGKSGEIFFPKLDATSNMRTFAEIAEHLLSELGLTPQYCSTEDEARQAAAAREVGDSSWPVYFFDSDTTGEKAFEEFYSSNETVSLDRFSGLGVVSGIDSDHRSIENIISSLRNKFADPTISKADIVNELSAVIDGFKHLETNRYLDQRM